jgi:hypothetical protein
MVLSLVVGWGVYERSRSLGEWDAWTMCLGRRIVLSAAVGTALAGVAHLLFQSVQLSNGVTLYQTVLFGASISSSVHVVIPAPPKIRIS